MPDLYVLDTSAIAAFTDQEEGAAEVERLLDAVRRGECQIEVCAISLMELYYVALQEKGEDEATKLIALVKAWPVRWVYPDERTLLQAGKIKATYRQEENLPKSAQSAPRKRSQRERLSGPFRCFPRFPFPISISPLCLLPSSASSLKPSAYSPIHHLFLVFLTFSPFPSFCIAASGTRRSRLTAAVRPHRVKAIEIARQQQAKSWELRAVMSLVRFRQQQAAQSASHITQHEAPAQLNESRTMLASVYNWFTEGFDTKDLQEARTLIEELSH